MLAHKIELKVNNKEITYFKKACGISRLAWNWGLIKWQEYYKKGIKTSGMELKKEFNSIKKKEFPFVYEVTKYAAQQPFIQLNEAYKRFFKGISEKPKLKKKNKSVDSFYIGGDQIKVKDKKVKIPNLGWIKMRENIRFEGKISNATISRIADKWFISFAIKPSMSYHKPCENQASVGIDLGIKHFAILSDGSYIDGPKPLKQKLKKLKRLSKQLSKKQHPRKKGDKTKISNNFKKHSLKIARLHAKIANTRKDFLHKVTTYLTNKFKYISIETLNVKGMMSNHKLSKAIADIGMYEFKRQLEYKANLKGNIILNNDIWFASSKTCPNCGNIKKDLTLKDRVYICDECGFKADRDLSAAINLHNQLPRVHREVTPVKITAMNLSAGLTDLTSIVEAGNKQ